MNYTIPPRQKPSDYAKGKLTQDEIIALQVANDANISSARKAVKMGVVEQLTPQQVSSPDELLADYASQEATARSNLEKLGFRPQEAAEIITRIRVDDALDFTQLNSNFPSIEADIKKRFTVKLLTPAFFVEYFRKYSDELAGVAGMATVFNPNGAGFNGLINNVGELRQILPDPRIIRYLMEIAANTEVNRGIIQRLDLLTQILPTADQLNALGERSAVDQQRVIQSILTQFQNMPSSADIRRAVEDLQRSGRTDTTRLAAILEDLIDAMPQGKNAVNILEEAGVLSSKIPRPKKYERQKSDASTTGANDEYDDEDDTFASPRGIASIQTQPYNVLETKQAKDRKAVETMINTKGGDPRTLTASQLAMFKQMTGVKSVAPTISDLTAFSGTSTESLGSSNAINSSTLAQIKRTFQVNPDLAPLLNNLITGAKVNYNDLSKSQNLKASSKKVFIDDTNIIEIFRTKFGSGIIKALPNQRSALPKPNMSKMKVGRGIAVKETPSYREYGKYAIHLPQLEQQDTLNVKYKSLGQIPKFKPMPVSDVFRDFILDLLDNGKPNARVYTQIPTDERKFFEEMSIGAGVWNGLGLKRTTTSNDEEENKRFELLKGEYMAGNNNPKVMSDLRRLIVKMMNDGRIRKNQGVELLMELSI